MWEAHAESRALYVNREGIPSGCFIGGFARLKARLAGGQRMPGIMPFIPRIIFCNPPLENCFIIFCI